MNRRGFTLLELLIAITMLGLIIGIISGALSLTSQALRKGSGRINDLERVKTSFFLMESQIQSLFVSQYVDEGEKKNLFAGQKDRLLFSTNYSVWGGVKGNSLVEYAVETDDRGKQRVRVTEKTIGLETRRQTLLFAGYDRISFEYFWKDLTGEGKWIEEWPPDEKGIPEKININLISGAKNTYLMVHVNVKAPSITSTSGGTKPAKT